jgi:NAD kinase
LRQYITEKESYSTQFKAPKECQEIRKSFTAEKSVNAIKLKVFDPEKYIEMNEKLKRDTFNVFSPEMEQSNENEKSFINFDYVFCMGGDGTLLRLLRIFYFHTRPLILPKIVTISMGSLNYLGNFAVKELSDVLEATILKTDL